MEIILLNTNTSNKAKSALHINAPSSVIWSNEATIKVTFPGKIKRIYRTYEGALNKIKLDNLRWIETNVIEYHKKIKLIS